MVVRLKEIGGGTNWLAPYLTATQILASSNEGLAHGISQAGAAIGGGIRHKKDADRQQAQFNASLAQNDAHFNASLSETKANRQQLQENRLRDDARETEKFNAQFLKAQIAKYEEDAQLLTAKAQGNSELGIAPDPSAQFALQKNQADKDSATSSLQTVMMRLGISSQIGASSTSHPGSASYEADAILADQSRRGVSQGGTKAPAMNDDSLPPPRGADKPGGCRKGEACDVGGPNKNAIDAPATSPVSAKPDATDPELAAMNRVSSIKKAIETANEIAKKYEKSDPSYSKKYSDAALTLTTNKLNPAMVALDDAKKAKTAAAETQRAIEAQSRKSIETARNQMNDLRAFGGGDMSELVNGVDLNDEETRNQIDILHTKMMAGRTAAALKSEQEKFTPDYRRHLESQIEADPESGIEDASGLSQAELVAATKEYNARQRAHAAKAEKDRSFDLKKSNSEEANADRDATRSIVEKKYRDHLTTSIAELEGELAGMSKDDDNAAKKWAKLGALKAEKAELEKGSGSAKPWAEDPAYKALSPAAKAAWDASHAR